MKYSGGCHCGKVKYDVEGELEEAMDCNCSICSKKGYLLWFIPEAQFTLLTDKKGYSTYAFGDKTIQHNFCPDCGCSPFGSGVDDEGNGMIAINVRCLDNISSTDYKTFPYDGRSA